MTKYIFLFRRKKSPPQFETLSEYTDESDESKKSTPCTPSEETKTTLQPSADRGATSSADGKNAPKPVEIDCHVDDDLCEISSSSEIEIGE